MLMKNIDDDDNDDDDICYNDIYQISCILKLMMIFNIAKVKMGSFSLLLLQKCYRLYGSGNNSGRKK